MSEANKSARTYLMFAIVVAILFIVNAVISYTNRKQMQQHLNEMTQKRDSLGREEVKLKAEINRILLSLKDDSDIFTIDTIRVGDEFYYKAIPVKKKGK